MQSVNEYLATLPGPVAGLFGQMAEVVKITVPSVEQGVSYAMPCFLYKGKPLISFIARKKHLSLYPYSGKVIEQVRMDLEGFEISDGSGSIHFAVAKPLPEDVLISILLARREEIEKGRSSK